MSISTLKTVFKVVILINFVISLYLGIYLAADQLIYKTLQFSLLQQKQFLRNETNAVTANESEVSTIDYQKLAEGLASSKNATKKQLRYKADCYDKDFKQKILEHGNFWILKNFIRASHGQLKCYESVTFTTHAEYTFLDKLVGLVDRWNAPVSIALYVPGEDFLAAMDSIAYLRDCLPQSHLIRRFVTFHMYFPAQHTPKRIFKRLPPAQCTEGPPYKNQKANKQYRFQQNLLYPVNVGRNIARDAALTHYVLACDMDLYPSQELVEKFLEMVAHNFSERTFAYPRVFSLPVFEIKPFVPIPNSKTELQILYKKNLATPYHEKFCAACQDAVIIKEWMYLEERQPLRIFRNTRRISVMYQWQPVFIGTHFDPYYDERMTWEDQGEKLSHAYTMCMLNYRFSLLDNAFLIRNPLSPTKADLLPKNQTLEYIRNYVLPRLTRVYGKSKQCSMLPGKQKVVMKNPVD